MYGVEGDVPCVLSIVTAPAGEPVSVAEAKAHLRLQTAADDPYVSVLVAAARTKIERDYGRQMVTATLRATYPCFPPRGGAIRLPASPLLSVSEVAYTDAGGDAQVLGADNYVAVAGEEPARVHLSATGSWPATLGQADAVRVKFVAGHGRPADVPAYVRQAVLMLVGHWYERRELIVVGRSAPTPLAVEWLLRSYWDGRY